MSTMARIVTLAVSFSISALVAAAPLHAGTISYAYDQLGRLSQVTYPGGAILRYNYDPNGNRTSYVVSGSSTTPPTGTTPIGQAQIVAPSAEAVSPTSTPTSSITQSGSMPPG